MGVGHCEGAPMFGVLRSYDAPEILVIVSATLFVVGSFFFYVF
jgi:hypothetical protein